jgi:hypothetical protein
MAPKSLECQLKVKGFKMNERIRELARQAVEQVCSKRTLSDGQIERVWHPDHFNQVFAELIVKECCGAVNDGSKLGDWYNMRIKEHFGVEL